SLNVMLAAVKFVHAAADLPCPSEDPIVRLMLKGMRRRHVRAQKQAAPLTGALLREILSRTDKTLDAVRDAAILALLYVFALRASELVGLDWRPPRHGTARPR